MGRNSVLFTVPLTLLHSYNVAATTALLLLVLLSLMDLTVEVCKLVAYIKAA
jgi:hypothetical protein